MPGADESGELADAGLAADILREAGGVPDAAESDRDEQTETEEQSAARPAPKSKSKPSRTSKPDAENDETADELDTETEAEEQELDEAAEEGTESTDETEGSDESEAEGESEEEEPAAEGETEQSASEDDTPEWAKRRFGEYARKVERLEQQLADANAKLNGSGNTARQNVADLDITAVESPHQLADLREQAERLEEWAELHPNGVEADPERPDQRSYTAEEVARVRINAKRKLRSIDVREKQLEHVQRFNEHASTMYPGFKDPDSDESRSMAYVLQQVPELRRLPNYRIIIGDAVAGERARVKAAQQPKNTKQGTNGKPLPGKPAAQVKGKPPIVNAAPARGNAAPAGKVAARQKARDRAFKTGSEADIARLVEASLGS